MIPQTLFPIKISILKYFEKKKPQKAGKYVPRSLSPSFVISNKSTPGVKN